MMKPQNIFDQYVDKLEYYPSQLDLHRHIFKYYTQQERAPQFLSIYDQVWLAPNIFTHDHLMQFLQAEPFQRIKIPAQISQLDGEFKLNILSAFKIYSMIQNNLKRKVEFTPDVMTAYQRLDTLFTELKEQPSSEDLRENKRQVDTAEPIERVAEKSGMAWVIILMICLVISVCLTLFTSGKMTLFFQAVCSGLIFAVAKILLNKSQQPIYNDRDSVQNQYLRQLDYFYEKMLLKQNKQNPQ